MRRPVSVFFWPIVAACCRYRSADTIDSELRVTVTRDSYISSPRRVEVVLQSGAPAQQWVASFRSLSVPDTVLAESVRLQGADIIVATVRVLGGLRDTLAVVPVRSALRPLSYYALSIRLGRRDPSVGELCVPRPQRVALASGESDTVYVALSGQGKNEIC